MKFIFSLAIFLLFGQIFAWFGHHHCGFRGCRRRFCDWNGCGNDFGYGFGRRNDFGYGLGRNFAPNYENNIANSNSNSIAINTGDGGNAIATSRSDAINARL